MAATFARAKHALAGVSVWPRYPTSYEINTWVWLSELRQKYGKKVDLSSVPSAEWDAIAAYGFDAVWLMGVWERSPAGISIANENKNLLDDFRRALPDFRPDDNIGSPYCVRRYVVDQHLGGPEGLGHRTAGARKTRNEFDPWTSCPTTWRQIIRGSPNIRSTSSEVMQTICGMTLPPTLSRMERFTPVDATPTFQPGLTYCN